MADQNLQKSTRSAECANHVWSTVTTTNTIGHPLLRNYRPRGNENADVSRCIASSATLGVSTDRPSAIHTASIVGQCHLKCTEITFSSNTDACFSYTFPRRYLRVLISLPIHRSNMAIQTQPLYYRMYSSAFSRFEMRPPIRRGNMARQTITLSYLVHSPAHSRFDMRPRIHQRNALCQTVTLSYLVNLLSISMCVHSTAQV